MRGTRRIGCMTEKKSKGNRGEKSKVETQGAQKGGAKSRGKTESGETGALSRKRGSPVVKSPKPRNVR